MGGHLMDNSVGYRLRVSRYGVIRRVGVLVSQQWVSIETRVKRGYWSKPGETIRRLRHRACMCARLAYNHLRERRSTPLCGISGTGTPKSSLTVSYADVYATFLNTPAFHNITALHHIRGRYPA
jgi:hypothetical protein